MSDPVEREHLDPGTGPAPDEASTRDVGDAAPGAAGPDELEVLDRRFSRHLRDQVVAPLEGALERYVAELRRAVIAMREVQGAEPESDDLVERERSSAWTRYHYTQRFGARFSEELFESATAARQEIFLHMDRITEAVPSLPKQVVAVGGTGLPAAPELVRPPWTRRAVAALTRSSTRTLPVRLLGRLYAAELARQLEAVASDMARLTAVAVAEIRRELHDHTELEGERGEIMETVETEAAAIAADLQARVAEIQEEFGRALRSAVDVPEHRPDAVAEQAAQGRAEILDDWAAFEAALMANVSSECVLSTVLARMEVTVADAARRLETVRDAAGGAPLDRLATGMGEIRDRAEKELASGAQAPVLERLASAALRLFEAELPRIAELRGRLGDAVEQLVAELEAVPRLVPEDLHISENPVPRIPATPRKLQLRDAPLESLLATACAGTLPRWLERSLATAREELEAMGQELQRVRNAVDFQLRAPLRGGFRVEETLEMAVGITERTVAQLVDLRAEGLASVDALIAGLESRTREEANGLRSAVASRDFLRIHSEIAEEQAVRQLSTGVERARGIARDAGRGAGKVWGVGGRVVTAVQDWAERQLGVGEVEREEMLESMEQSLLGEEQQVVELPAMYRQLFDVEGVPWDELLVRRSDELEVIRRAFRRWQEDRSSTLAVVGEKGSGKSTLVRMARKHVFGDMTVRSVQLGSSIDAPADLESRLKDAFNLDGNRPLTEAINRRPPAVVVVEDLHHLFVRALGGFDAMEYFLEVLAATRQNVLWVITIDSLAWRYLDRVLGIGAHFVHTVDTSRLAPEKLEQAIMARHDVSGFALRFEAQAEERARRWWNRRWAGDGRGELTRKESQRRRFFQQLADIAEGNIVLALFYWLRSIRRVEEHVLVLGEPEMIDLEFLERLPLPQVHTIAAIILHGGLSEATHRRVFQIPAAESRLQLAALADAHMIFLSEDGEYKINKVLYRPFIRLLASRNIV